MFFIFSNNSIITTDIDCIYGYVSLNVLSASSTIISFITHTIVTPTTVGIRHLNRHGYKSDVETYVCGRTAYKSVYLRNFYKY